MQPKPRSSEVLRVGLSAILKRLFAEVIGSVRLLRSDLPLHSVLNVIVTERFLCCKFVGLNAYGDASCYPETFNRLLWIRDYL